MNMRPAARKVHLAREFRKNQTVSERIFWERVRAKRFQGLKFRRQAVLYGYIVDFLCYRLRLIVEIDGAVHDSKLQYDQGREGLLRKAGYHFFRVSAEAVENNVQSVMEDLQEFIRSLNAKSEP
jgi:very-short-patch-repair endonuclease